jgi:hypothetical protein
LSLSSDKRILQSLFFCAADGFYFVNSKFNRVTSFVRHRKPGGSALEMTKTVNPHWTVIT